ncbi:hypothetical protein M0R45_017665 [Rubus argutus]|uniref:Cytochrome P450 n=1 Tax=Rubus argutus TaxID=59490 RepID=A0AAW1XXQ4_RUBAR
MELLQLDAKMLMSLAVLGVIGILVRLYNRVVVKPKRLRSLLTKQGISGPSPAFLLGNSREIREARPRSIAKALTSETPTIHNCSPVLFPIFEQWRKQYGEVFVFALGNTQILYVTEPQLVKEITTCTSWDLGKPSHQSKDHGPLLGLGVLTANGALWSKQRKIIAPELYMEKVKPMINTIVDCTNTLVNSWNSKIEAGRGAADINVDADLRRFSCDVISRACFGSSYTKGVQIWGKIRQLQESMAKKIWLTGIPGLRHLPTKNNRDGWRIGKEAANLILRVAKERHAGHNKDLLQMIIEGAKDSDFTREETDRFIVDNCKNIYLAGYETTSLTATWCLMLLAVNQDWQERVRAEVLQICQGRIPDADMLNKMKQLTMVIHETLRLYPATTVLSREALQDLKFGNITVPKGVNIWINMVTLHTDPELWGPDAYRFNPDRFVNGVSGACKFPSVYMPFGIGTRVCIGQNFAMTELKVILALILSKFSFSLSSKYIHKPCLTLVLEPEHGVELLMKKL